MTWVRVDDQFQDHPKFIDVSLAGVGLWVAGLAYSSRYLTDGFVPRAAAKRLGGSSKLTDELVAVRLWREIDGGWLIHDYTDYNPTADAVRHTRAKRAEAGKRGGQARGRQKQAEANGKQLAFNASNNLSGSKKSLNQANRNPLIRHDSVSKPPPSDKSAGHTHAAQANLKQVAWPLLSPRPVPSPTYLSSETTSPPPNARCFEEEDRTTVGNEALKLIVNRRLAKRDPRLEPIKSVRRWREATATDVLLEHGDQLLDLIGKGLDAEAVADTIEPVAPLTLVQPPDPPCRRCHGMRHPPDDEHLLPPSEQDLTGEAM